MAPETISSAPNERAQYLLRVLIQRFIRDGQPVGSRTLSRDAGIDLSPATIRNVMSDLPQRRMLPPRYGDDASETRNIGE